MFSTLSLLHVTALALVFTRSALSCQTGCEFRSRGGNPMGIVEKKNTSFAAEGLHKEYPMGKDQRLHVLKGLDMEVREGEMAVIIGPSGSGKSTLAASIRWTGSALIREGDREQLDLERSLRRGTGRHFGIKLSVSFFSFIICCRNSRLLRMSQCQRSFEGRSFMKLEARAASLLQEVGLGERVGHKPSELSGGEQQRVAVARALMNDPRLVLADEPSGNLDEDNSQKLHQLLSDLAQKRGLTFVIATHNLDLTKRANRVLQLSDGKLVTGLRSLT